jgi:hypothetical protein
LTDERLLEAFDSSELFDLFHSLNYFWYIWSNKSNIYIDHFIYLTNFTYFYLFDSFDSFLVDSILNFVVELIWYILLIQHILHLKNLFVLENFSTEQWLTWHIVELLGVFDWFDLVG